jgi:hypothetical protein
MRKTYTAELVSHNELRCLSLAPAPLPALDFITTPPQLPPIMHCNADTITNYAGSARGSRCRNIVRKHSLGGVEDVRFKVGVSRWVDRMFRGGREVESRTALPEMRKFNLVALCLHLVSQMNASAFWGLQWMKRICIVSVRFAEVGVGLVKVELWSRDGKK